MSPEKLPEEDSTEKVTILERTARALKATINLLVYRHILTREELQFTGKAKKEKKDLSNRLAKLAWIFDSVVSVLEEKQMLNSTDTDSIYSLRNRRKNPDRAAGLAAGELIAALKVLLDCLTNKNLITKQDASEVLKKE